MNHRFFIRNRNCGKCKRNEKKIVGAFSLRNIVVRPPISMPTDSPHTPTPEVNLPTVNLRSPSVFHAMATALGHMYVLATRLALLLTCGERYFSGCNSIVISICAAHLRRDSIIIPISPTSTSCDRAEKQRTYREGSRRQRRGSQTFAFLGCGGGNGKPKRVECCATGVDTSPHHTALTEAVVWTADKGRHAEVQ